MFFKYVGEKEIWFYGVWGLKYDTNIWNGYRYWNHPGK